MSVYCTVSEIFSVKEWRDRLSRLLKMAPFDRPNTTFYWSAIVSIALCSNMFELFDVAWCCDLETWVTDHSRSFKLVPFESLGAVSYSPSIVTMTLCGIISEIKRDIGRKSWFLYLLAFDAPVRVVPVGILPWRLVWKTRMVWLPEGEYNLKLCLFVLSECTNVIDGQTDRQTDGQTPHDG